MGALLRRPRCSLLDVAALVLPVWLLVLVCHTAADADLWGHLRFGADLLNGHGLTASDPYSFTSDISWINHEWLSEGVLAAVFAAAGTLGLNLLKLGVIAAIGVIAWHTARRAGASLQSALLLTTLLLLATYTRTQVLRPQLFSVLMFALLVDRLRRSHRNRRLIEIPAVMCVWANLHGAWVVGMATLVVWITVETVEARVAQRFGAATPTPHSIPKAALLLSAALTATLLNPYGWAQWSFLRDTVGLSRTDISDWAPFIALPVPIIVLDLVMPALVLLSWFVYRRAVRLRDAAVVALLAFGTLRVGRVDAFLQVSIGLLFAPELLALFNGAAMRLARYERLRSETAVNFAAATALAVVAVASAAPRLTQIAVEGPWIPDRDAVRFLRAESPHTHLLTWFDWGEYAIWHLSGAGIRVSMDGRRETVYSPRVLHEHWAFYRNDANSWMYPDQIGADCIWLPRRLPIVARLREHGWNVAFESGRSIVLSRENGRTLIASSQDASPQFFPAE